MIRGEAPLRFVLKVFSVLRRWRARYSVPSGCLGCTVVQNITPDVAITMNHRLRILLATRLSKLGLQTGLKYIISLTLRLKKESTSYLKCISLIVLCFCEVGFGEQDRKSKEILLDPYSRTMSELTTQEYELSNYIMSPQESKYRPTIKK